VGFAPAEAMHYDLTDLRLFLNVGETKNLTRAAERSFDAVCRMVEAGAGIAIVPNSCARRYASRKVLRFIRLEDAWARRELQLVRRPGRELPQFAETLIQYLADAAREPV